MSLNNHLDEIRRNTLARIEKSERARYVWIAAAAVVEGVCLIAFILLADFSDRVHLLIFISACLVYFTLALGIMALGAFTQSWCLRIVKAIEQLSSQRTA